MRTITRGIKCTTSSRIYRGKSESKSRRFNMRCKRADAGMIVKRFITARFRMRRAARSINKDDVFSGEPLDLAHDCHLFCTTPRTSDNTHYSFRSRELLAYILCSGTFQNPFTREDFTDDELHRLQRTYVRSLETLSTPPLEYVLANMKCLACPKHGFDIVKIKTTLEEDRRQQQLHEMLVDMLRSECLDTLAEMMSCLDEDDFDEATALTPAFLHQYTAVFQTCKATAAQMRITALCDIYNHMMENTHQVAMYADLLSPIIGKFVTLLRSEQSMACAIHADVLSRVMLLVYASGEVLHARSEH